MDHRREDRSDRDMELATQVNTTAAINAAILDLSLTSGGRRNPRYFNQTHQLGDGHDT